MSVWSDMLNKLDANYQIPAVKSEKSAIVAAGAGSGKTQVLAMRYLFLIKERHISPDRILCLTFTNKAASEMNERIHGMLKACASDDPDFKQALNYFNPDRISTLDSLCAEIARNVSPAWGIVSNFSTEKNVQDRLALAVEFLLNHRSQPAVSSFIAAVGFEKAANALLSLTLSREALIASKYKFDYKTLKKNLDDLFEKNSTAIIRLLENGLSLDAGTSKGVQSWIDFSRIFCNKKQHLKTDYELLKAIKKTRGSSDADNYYNSIADEIRERANIAWLILDIYTDALIPEVIDMLNSFIDIAKQDRASRGVLTFADVASIALAGLTDDKALQAWYKSNFDAIMIDEFQDDNELQKLIVFNLCKNMDTGLFFVGDEKQSIYAFRGADVSVFRNLADELKDIAHYLPLVHNYRSEPNLIDFFNYTFSKIMPEQSDTSYPSYVARFVSLQAAKPTKDVVPEVVWCEYNPEAISPIADDEKLSATEAEAWHVAEIIQRLVSNKVLVPYKNAQGLKEARPCQYEDIAILFRSTASQNTVERYLRLFDIPYTSLATASLYTESILGDIYNILRLLVYPEDLLSKAAVLSGPFCGLSDMAVFSVLGNQDSFELDSLDQSKLDTLTETLAYLTEHADRSSIAELVTYLWYERGLNWNVLKDISLTSFLEHFDYVWAFAAEADANGLALVDFIASLESKIGNVDKTEEQALRESTTGVSLMTVHISKGLEFPVVIIPNIENVGRNSDDAIIKTKGPFSPSIPIFNPLTGNVNNLHELTKAVNELKKLNDDITEKLAEIQRLCYVACTRAISHLFFLGKIPKQADKQGKGFRSLLLKAWPSLGPESQKNAADFQPKVSNDELSLPEWLKTENIQCRSKNEYYKLYGKKVTDSKELASSIIAMDQVETQKHIAVHPVTSVGALKKYPQATDAVVDKAKNAKEFLETDFGTLCHHYVEKIIHEPDVIPSIPNSLKNVLNALPTNKKDEILNKALLFANNFITSEHGKRALASKNLHTEYSFVWHHDSTAHPIFLSGSIDLLYEYNDIFYVIDFKTDIVENAKAHSFQLEMYRIAIEEIFKKKAKAFVYFLRTGNSVEITDNMDTAHTIDEYISSLYQGNGE